MDLQKDDKLCIIILSPLFTPLFCIEKAFFAYIDCFFIVTRYSLCLHIKLKTKC